MPFSRMNYASYTWPVNSFYTRTPPKRHIYGLVHKQEINTGMVVQWRKTFFARNERETGKEQHMATISQPLTGATTREFPQSSVRFDWMVILLEAWWVGGLFVDGWAHAHGKVDQSFFTPWHAILYAGFFVN